jgi:crotonobetainyl-CoA:carnitine CoA-transferase CaiB-like acyl-CoA transferase
MGYSRLLTRHRRPYRTRDGYLAVVVYNDKHWRAFFELAGDLPTFASDPRFQTAAARADNYDAIYAYLADVLATRTSAEWLALLQAADIPCGPVNAIEDLPDDPQLRAVGFFDESRRMAGHMLRRIAPRFRAPGASQTSALPAPTIGEQTAELIP